MALYVDGKPWYMCDVDPRKWGCINAAYMGEGGLIVEIGWRDGSESTIETGWQDVRPGEVIARTVMEAEYFGFQVI